MQMTATDEPTPLTALLEDAIPADLGGGRQRIPYRHIWDTYFVGFLAGIRGPAMRLVPIDVGDLFP